MTNPVRIKSTQMIQPSEPTFSGILPLTEFERIVSFGSYIPWVYFYKSTTIKDHGNVSSSLRDSLARTLVHFYPFTGRLVFNHQLTSVELRCGGRDDDDDDDSSSGAMFIEAESSSELADFGENFSDFYQFQHIIPSVDEMYDRSPKEMYNVPLLLVQLTTFGCGGFSIGISMSHSVVDGLSASHFIKEWARITRGEPLETPPFIARTSLTADKALNSDPRCDVPNIKQEGSRDSETRNHEEPSKIDFSNKTTMVMLPLTKNQVEQLKNIAVSINDVNGSDNKMATPPPARPYTRYEVITAHIWRCLCKAKGQTSTLTSLGVIVDVRTRIHPPLPTSYFGNGVLMVAASSKSTDIITNPLSFTCANLRKTINSITDDYIKSDIDYLKRLRLHDTPKSGGGLMVRTADGMKVSLDLSVTSWLRLPLTGMDFGWGDEVCMRSGPTSFEGVTAIMPHGKDGGINVVVCFQSGHMDGFVKYFYGDICGTGI